MSDSLWPQGCGTPGSSVLHYLQEFTQIHVHWVSDALQPSHPLPLPSHFAFNISKYQGVFQWVSSLHTRWPRYWTFSFNVSPSNEYWGFIPFLIDWFDLLAVQGTLKGLLQQHSPKPSILRHSAFFIVQPSHPYMTIGKTVALSRWTHKKERKERDGGDRERIQAFNSITGYLFLPWDF